MPTSLDVGVCYCEVKWKRTEEDGRTNCISCKQLHLELEEPVNE